MKHSRTQVTPISVTLTFQYAASLIAAVSCQLPTSSHPFTHTHRHTPLTYRCTAEGLTFRLTVGTVLVVVLPQQFRQDGLMLLVQFLGFFSLRPRCHLAKSLGCSPACVEPIKKKKKSECSACVKQGGTSPCIRTVPTACIQLACNLLTR